jgi:myo-inositol-1(or 4)-monophosphatase
MDEIESDLKLLITAVKLAGRKAMEFRQKGSIQVWRKSDGSAVSEVDLAANEIAEQCLRRPRPSYGWLSEEGRDTTDRLEAGRVWIIDPIDGTQAYLSGKDDWCVAAALCINGRPVLGAIFNAARNELFAGRAGHGATMNGQRLKVRDRGSLEGARLIAPRNQLRQQFWGDALPAFEAKWANSIAYRLSLVACGQADAAISLSPKSEWDVAAGVVIAAEAGCIVTDQHGNTPRFNNPQPRIDGIIAAPPILHGELLRLRKQRLIPRPIDVTEERKP